MRECIFCKKNHKRDSNWCSINCHQKWRYHNDAGYCFRQRNISLKRYLKVRKTDEYLLQQKKNSNNYRMRNNEKCNKISLQYMKELYKERRKQGLCVQCGEKCFPFALCKKHRIAQAKSRKLRILKSRAKSNELSSGRELQK